MFQADVVHDDKDAEAQGVVDDGQFPLVWTTFPERASLAFVEGYFSMLHRQAKRGPFVLVCDMRPLDTSTANAQLRSAFFEASDRFDRVVGPAHYLGEAIIVGSTLQRALLSAYTWFVADTFYPRKVFRTEAEARAWCEQRIAAAGLRFD